MRGIELFERENKYVRVSVSLHIQNVFAIKNYFANYFANICLRLFNNIVS